ncbi:hypothetical protein Golomagni_05202, partial [Golovinomyces magnicellulatus]
REKRSQKAITDYILNAIDSYHELGWRDDNLWEVFREDFEGWVADDFVIAHKNAVRILRDHLLENGVWVTKKKGFAIPIALQQVLEEESQHVWPSEEIHAQIPEQQPELDSTEELLKLQLHSPSQFSAQVNNNYTSQTPNIAPKQSHVLMNPKTPPNLNNKQHVYVKGKKILQTNNKNSQYNKDDFDKCQSRNCNEQPNIHFRPLNTLSQDKFNYLGADHHFEDENEYQDKIHHHRPQFHGKSSAHQRRQYTPPFHIPRQTSYNYENSDHIPAHDLGILSRIYMEEDRYGGSDDCLDLCIDIFYGTCRKAGVNHQFFKDAFSIMLKGSAREYYHMYLLNEALSFYEMISRIRAHFETAERQGLMLSKWKNFSLQKTIEQNPTISSLECFNILVKDIRKTQLGLPSRYRGDESLWDAVVDAVRDVPECSFACYKPAANFEAVCADIRASIATQGRLNSKSAFHSQSLNHIPTDQLYTDRRYGGAYIRQKGKNINSQFRAKVCSVCKRKGCWSSKHNKNERDKAFELFRERLKSKNKTHDDRAINHYVIECEGEHDEEDGELDLWDPLIINLNINEDNEDNENLSLTNSQSITTYGVINGYETILR